EPIAQREDASDVCDRDDATVQDPAKIIRQKSMSCSWSVDDEENDERYGEPCCCECASRVPRSRVRVVRRDSRLDLGRLQTPFVAAFGHGKGTVLTSWKEINPWPPR